MKPGDNDLYYGESNQGHTIYEDGTCLTGGHARQGKRLKTGHLESHGHHAVGHHGHQPHDD